MLYDDQPVEVGRPKQRAVLAALLLHANQVVSVARLAEVLWRDGGAGRSTGSLPVYVANLRRLLEPDRPARTPPERILTRAPGYLLRVGPGEYDVADFERLAAEGSRHLAEGRPRAAQTALGEALSLWRGPALEEFPFAEIDAARLEALRLAATENRFIADLTVGAHGALVADLERAIGEQPLRECLVGLLMVALYRSGRQSEALRAFTRARERLGEELGIEPGPDLRRLEADILAQSPKLDWRPPPPEGVAPELATPAAAQPAEVRPEVFVGRAAELELLDRALTPTAGSSPAIVLVAGEPGIGKTRLVREAAARAAAREVLVAWGRCDEREGAPPFWPWIEVIRALLADPDADAVRAALAGDGADIGQLVPDVKELLGSLPPPPPLDPAAARHRFFEAVAGFLLRLGRHRPLAIILDDLHWGDAPSLELTAHLARRLSGSNVCLVVTYRDVDPAPDAALTEVLASLAREPGRVDLTLRGLTRDEVAEFVALEAGTEAVASMLAAVWDRAGGNPFFVGELIRLLVAEKTAPTATGAGVPWAVRQVVARRRGRLPKATRRLLAIAAVAGTSFDLRVVARAAAVDLERALDQIDVSVAAGLVTEQPDSVERFQFSHALVQEAIYDELTRLRRARLHGLVATALEEIGGDHVPATEVAHHLYESVAVSGPGRAVVAAGRAATAAQAALAYEVAEDHLHRGLALVATMPAGPERDRSELDLQVQLASLLSLVKGVATLESARAWERAKELCRAVEDERQLLLSLWGLLTFAWASGDMRGARTLAEHMLPLRRTSSDPAVTVTAHLGLGLVAVCRGDLIEGEAHLAAGKAVADAVDEEALADATFGDLRVQVDSWLSMARHLQGDHDEGRRLIDAAVERAGAIGGPIAIATALSFALFACVLSDDAAGGERLAEELISQTDRLQLTDFTYHGRVVRAWALASAGAPEVEVATLLRELPSAVTAGIRPWHPFWLALTAETWHALGYADEAQRLVAEAQAEVDAMGSSFSSAEVHRLQGELLAELEPRRRAEALDSLLLAAREAEEQGATILRDRALASAARVEGPGASQPAPGARTELRRDPPSPGPRTDRHASAECGRFGQP